MLFQVQFLYPALLFLAIPAAIILLWLTMTSFVKDDPRFEDRKSMRRRSKLRWTVFVLRTLAVLLLIIAIATPLVKQSIVRAGDTHITVLLDNSSSMAVMDTSFVNGLIDQLRQQVPVTVKTIALGDSSPLGEAALANLKQNENLLLISDGYSTTTPSLAEVASFASQMNATINAIDLKPKSFDAAVSIVAPEKAIADTNATFTVLVTETNSTVPVQLKVTVDGTEVYNDAVTGPVNIQRKFSQGKHQISAEILDQDANPLNNDYDYLLSVVQKPAVLVVESKPSSLDSIFSQLYTVNTSGTLATTEAGLKGYYAVFIVDEPVASVAASTQALTQYLLDGNGMFVIGGPRSYDYGGYKNSVFESLLPVSVGKAQQRQGISNIVMVMDLTGSVAGSYSLQPDGTLKYTASDEPALVKALTNSVLDDIDVNNNVGVLVVGAKSANLSQNIVNKDELVMWDYVGGEQLGRVSPLGPKKTQLMDAIPKVNGGSQAASELWIAAPLTALQTVSGSKNIIIITDGQSCIMNCNAALGGSDQEATINLAATVAALGGKVYTVNVNPGQFDDFLGQVAHAGNGIYFPASQKNKLRILFGDPTQTTGPEAYGLVILDANHFITQGVQVQATMYGFNEVIPKSYSSLLVTAGAGQPALTVWNYGVGRVASLTTYNGDDYGELVGKGNSLLLSRTGNWLIGDPERMQAYVVSVPQLHVNEKGTITVKSDSIPVNPELSFSPKGQGIYQADFTPEQAGFGTVGGIGYAASYPQEYENVGMNPDLSQILAISKGRVFEPGDAAGILDHVQTVRQLQEAHNQPFRTPFLLAAAVLFLVEIAIRRIYEIVRARNA